MCCSRDCVLLFPRITRTPRIDHTQHRHRMDGTDSGVAAPPGRHDGPANDQVPVRISTRYNYFAYLTIPMACEDSNLNDNITTRNGRGEKNLKDEKGMKEKNKMMLVDWFVFLWPLHNLRHLRMCFFLCCWKRGERNV